MLVPRGDGRATLRALPRAGARRTPAQETVAERFRPLAQAWNALTIEEALLWKAYGRGLGARDGRAVQANNAFTALGAKLLQMRPDDPLPRRPPTAPFLGDGIRVVAAPQGSALRFEAGAPNAPGVVTELVVQPLKSRLRTPDPKKYRTRGFVAFAPGALSCEIPLPRGAFAAGVRFVEAATGRETAALPLGVFEGA